MLIIIILGILTIGILELKSLFFLILSSLFPGEALPRPAGPWPGRPGRGTLPSAPGPSGIRSFPGFPGPYPGRYSSPYSVSAGISPVRYLNRSGQDRWLPWCSVRCGRPHCSSGAPPHTAPGHGIYLPCNCGRRLCWQKPAH